MFLCIPLDVGGDVAVLKAAPDVICGSGMHTTLRIIALGSFVVNTGLTVALYSFALFHGQVGPCYILDSTTFGCKMNCQRKL